MTEIIVEENGPDVTVLDDGIEVVVQEGNRVVVEYAGEQGPPGPIVNLGDLLDVTLTDLERGDIPFRGLTDWLNLHHGVAGQALLSGGHGADPYFGDAGVGDHGLLTGLGDDDHLQYHTDGRALTWHGTLAGAHVTGGDAHDHVGGDGAQIDHGGLAGLADDDHTQYHNDVRGDLRYAKLAGAELTGDFRWADTKATKYGAGGLGGALGCDSKQFSDGTLTRWQIESGAGLIYNPALTFASWNVNTMFGVWIPRISMVAQGNPAFDGKFALMNGLYIVGFPGGAIPAEFYLLDSGYPTDGNNFHVYFDDSTHATAIDTTGELLLQPTSGQEVFLPVDSKKIWLGAGKTAAYGMSYDGTHGQFDPNAKGTKFGGTIATVLNKYWDMGAYSAGAIAATGIVTIKIDGTTYKLLAST
jgi:hypothetical protein